MHILMRWAYSECFVEVWKDTDLERVRRRVEGKVRGMGQLLCERYNCTSTLILAKRQQKADVIEEYKNMNDMKKLNRE